MIIDAHTHIHQDADGLGTKYDARIDHLLQAMDQAGVTKAIVMAEAVDVPYIKRISNEFVAEICAKHDNRLIGFASVHPGDPDAPRQLEYALDTLGLKGLKLHPRFQGIAADDPRCVELVQIATSRNVPCAVDAFLWKPYPLRVQLPLNIDSLCKQVPDARIIMNHAGGFHFLDALAVAIANDHVYLELSVTLPFFAGTPFEDQFVFVLKQLGPRRLIFGSDHPQKSLPVVLQTTRDMLGKAGFSEEDAQWVLGKNVMNLLGNEES